MARLISVFLVALTLLLPACGKRTSAADAVRFNDGLVVASNRVTKSAQAFGDALEPAVAGGIEQVAKVKRELENVEEALQRAHADMRLLTVPESASAMAFLVEHQKLLAHQEKLVKEDFSLIVRVLSDPALSAADRRKRIAPIARYIESMDQGAYQAIQQAQQAFAREHGFKLR